MYNNLGITAYEIEMKITGKVITETRFDLLPRHADVQNPTIVVPSINNTLGPGPSFTPQTCPQT